MSAMTIYPARWPGRLGRAVLDVLAVAWTAASVLAGLTVHGLVLGLQVISGSIVSTGNLLNSWVTDFQHAVPQGVPVVSGALNTLVGGLPRSPGDPLVQSGMSASDRINQLAVGLGLFVAAVPILALIPLYLFWRVRDVRERSAAQAFVEAAQQSGQIEQAKALLAHRAIVRLPFRDLMDVSSDPVADLAGGRHDALAAALLRRAGLHPLPPDAADGASGEG